MKFSDEQRGMFLLQLEVLDYPKNEYALSEISKRPGAPSRKTLRRWWNEKDSSPGGKIALHKKQDLVEALTELLHLHVDAAKEAVKDNDDLRSIDVGIGILIDKLQLLSGGPTERQEINVTDHRERILAGIARKADGYVTGTSGEIHQRPIG